MYIEWLQKNHGKYEFSLGCGKNGHTVCLRNLNKMKIMCKYQKSLYNIFIQKSETIWCLGKNRLNGKMKKCKKDICKIISAIGSLELQKELEKTFRNYM